MMMNMQEKSCDTSKNNENVNKEEEGGTKTGD